MPIKHYNAKKYTRYIIVMICIVWYGTISIAQHRKQRQTTDAFFNDLSQSSQNIDLPIRQQQYIAVHNALTQNNIPAAIHSIPDDNATDLYNRWTLKTLRAYAQLASWDTQTYDEIVQEAIKDFDKALQQTNNPLLQQRITYNKNITNNINDVGILYSCFENFWSLIEQLETITTTITSLQETIQEQISYIQTNQKDLLNHISQDCLQNLNKTFLQTHQSLNIASDEVNKQIPKYTQILWEYMQDPSWCFWTDIAPLNAHAADTQEQLDTLSHTYNITYAALQTKDEDILTQMCAQSQDDTLSNQKTEKSLQQLLQDLENSTKQSPQNPTEDFGSNTSPQYIPLTEQEQDALDQIDTANKDWIQIMTKIKQQWYTPSETLKTLFDVFYGNDTEFRIPWR